MHRLLALSVLAFACASPASAQSGANVLLVVNEASADSVRIAERYARARSVPPEQILRITVDAADEVERSVFGARIQAPIATWLRQHFAQDRILYIVLTKGIPLRIRGTAGRDGTAASVDSELTLLYRRLVGHAPPPGGRVANPYFAGAAPMADAKPFSRAALDVYLVTRLDGFTAADVEGLIDRAVSPSPNGRILLDMREGAADGAGNQWLAAAAGRLAKSPLAGNVVLDTSAQVLTGQNGVLGYYAWGSNDVAMKARRSGLGFVPGAIAGLFVSTDGRTFTEPPPSWGIGKWSDRTTFFAGSPQSLAGDLIREGVTGIAANVQEPFLDAAVRPDILFPAYVSGFNLAESFYLAMPFLSWQTIVIGDPLCAPFPRRAAEPAEIDKGIDPTVELPGYFAARRLQFLAQTTTPEAARAVLRSEARTARDDKAGAQKALEEATALDPKLVAAHVALAGEYEAQKDYDKAIARYRAVLAANPDSVVVLNNLAYTLAVHKGQPGEAIGLAERAMTLAGGKSPEVADTLAWVQHLLGRDREAAGILELLVKSAPARAEFRLHAAVVFAAVGRLEEAAAELREAVRLDPALEKSDEAKALRAKLGG